MTTYLTTDEVADRLRETPATIARQCAAGKIPAARIGGRWLIAESVVEAMLQPTNVDRTTRTRSTATRRRSA
jgi:excisionase family DNA binding protein